MNSRDLLYLIQKGWHVILISLAASLVAGCFLASTQSEVYVSRSQIMVDVSQGLPTSHDSQQNLEKKLRSYIAIVQAEPSTSEISNDTGSRVAHNWKNGNILYQSAGERATVNLKFPKDDYGIEITVRSKSSSFAAALLIATQNQVLAVSSPPSGLTDVGGLEEQVFQAPQVFPMEESPRRDVEIISGVSAVGLFVGLGFAYFWVLIKSRKSAFFGRR